MWPPNSHCPPSHSSRHAFPPPQSASTKVLLPLLSAKASWPRVAGSTAEQRSGYETNGDVIEQRYEVAQIVATQGTAFADAGSMLDAMAKGGTRGCVQLSKLASGEYSGIGKDVQQRLFSLVKYRSPFAADGSRLLRRWQELAAARTATQKKAGLASWASAALLVCCKRALWVWQRCTARHARKRSCRAICSRQTPHAMENSRRSCRTLFEHGRATRNSRRRSRTPPRVSGRVRDRTHRRAGPRTSSPTSQALRSVTWSSCTA